MPTFVAFHPWLTLDGYCDLLDRIDQLDLVDHVAPIQLAIRLLIPEGSRLLELDDVRARVGPFDAATLAYPWVHADPRVDDLQREIAGLVGVQARRRSPGDVRRHRGAAPTSGPAGRPARPDHARDRSVVPQLSEPWYCCAEPNPEHLSSRVSLEPELRRVLLFATTTGYQTRSFGDAAARLGVELVFATDRCDMLEDPWQDAAIPVRFHDEDASVAAILERARTHPIDGILVVGDRPTAIAAMVGEALGLAGHQPMADGRRAQQAAAPANGCATATCTCRGSSRPTSPPIRSELAAGVCSIRASSSRCRCRAAAASCGRTTQASFVEAFLRLRKLLASPDVRAERDDAHDGVLVEGFIEGWEFALEGLLHHGSLYVLALFDKPDPLDGPFFEETIYVTPSLAPEPMQRDIVDAIARAAAAIGLTHGPVHAECRVNDRGVYVLEVAARPIGGLCAGALEVREARGARAKAESDFARGAAAAPRARRIARRLAARGRGVGRHDDSDPASRASTAASRASRRPGPCAASTTCGSRPNSTRSWCRCRRAPATWDSSSPAADTPADAEQSLRDAHACLRFAIDPEVPMVQITTWLMPANPFRPSRPPVTRAAAK